MARYLKSIDPYHHPVTTSFGNSEGDPNDDALPELNYVQTHNYDSRDIAAMAARYSQEKARKYGKPHYIGEFGADVEGHADAADRSGTHFHNGLWAPLFSLSAGTGMLWWWDNYVDPQNLYHEFRPVARFARGVPWNRLRWSPLAVEEI